MTNKNLNRSNTTQLPEVGDEYRSISTGTKYTCTKIELNRNIHTIWLKSDGSHSRALGFYLEDMSLFEPLPKEQDHNEDKLDKVEEAKEELKQKIWGSTSLIISGDDLTERLQQLIEVRNSAQNLINALEDMSKKDDNLPMKEERLSKIRDKVESEKVYFPENPEFISTDWGKKGGDMTCHTKYSRDEKGNIKIEDVKYEEPTKKTEESSPKSCECNHKVESCPDCVVEEEPKSIWKNVSELPKCHCQVFVKFKNHNNIFIYDCDGSSIVDLNKDELDLEYVKSFCSLTDFINQQEQNTKDIAELKQLIKGE